MNQNPSGTTLRLVYPQWQGAGTDVVREEIPGIPFDDARRAYALGSQILQLMLPPHIGPTEVVPIDTSNEGLDEERGVLAYQAIRHSLTAAQQAMARHCWDRILVLGGDCGVSVAPFSALAEKYGEDLAIIWVDTHPDVGTPDSLYKGFHAMALAALTGRGEEHILASLPATVPATHVAIAGLHVFDEEEHRKLRDWGITVFGPDDLRTDPAPLLAWRERTGCSRVAIHFDVDTIDSREMGLGLGRIPGGLSSIQVRSMISSLAESVDVVGLTIAEFIPRDALALRNIVSGFPLLRG